MPMLTAQAILDAQDLAEEVVPIPEWGGSVRVRALSRGAYHEATKAATEPTQDGKGELNGERFEQLLFVASVVEPAFTADQAGLLSAKSASAMAKVMAVVLRINGLTPEAVTKAKKSAEA
jgi:hypothetical protein